MNFIFDIGNVLLYYRPKLLLSELFTDELVMERLNTIIFQSDEWYRMDIGLLTYKEACEMIGKREPELASAVKLTFEKIPGMFTEITEAVELLPVIKEQGHTLYYLSNMHRELGDYILNKFLFFTYFDGGVFSCDLHVNKPSHKIYNHLFEKYFLSPGDCIFFDDMAENIATAQELGMKGILFKNAESVKPYIH
jgi:putative hydrolase of the HAD superfamily